MKTAIIALAISIIAMLGIGIFLPNQEKVKNECDDIKEEAYIVCLQEENYFRENLE
ncbi:hypothetical protein PN480_03280 [Dolichospermum circinale CS-1225]|uniref:TMhelix containing protein n=1 Tax=Dolichospermum circinale CS-537/01 TaxID=3021739 RepID=A0ABT5A6H2_9CYAN|nr:hypothetical protein [Dolichospermum circinale]MDB9453725.1 hypothetical protein [Dolichospermum circinale CS-541/06]MDB9464584.1 hypothetical protein [Dolichospermum circinale CS-541/04]MDB9466580.1 hypothetical protein [Dolichospermum circinale CS-539/09]MDB9471997.1 hypothetical protein [Dolichospermum circinale CS-539]MDB9487554.1 hypothetical protein [Dolichospermum circinale CS-537/01]